MSGRQAVINKINVTILGDIEDAEILLYLENLQRKNRFKIIAAIVLVDGEHVDVNYTLDLVPFERVRRITGYLVGNTGRWNNAKRSELRDRVKHGN